MRVIKHSIKLLSLAYFLLLATLFLSGCGFARPKTTDELLNYAQNEYGDSTLMSEANDDMVFEPESEPFTPAIPLIPDSSKLTDYLMVYFTGNEKDQEAVFMSVSSDGLYWEDVNEGKAVLTSSLGTKGVRDPFILRKQDGTFVIIATDLCIAADGDWWKCQWNGSKSIVIWESEDLINWSEPRLVKVMDNAGCVWAPEAVYDPENDDYMVFWASRVKDDNYAMQRIYYSKTTDFCSFTEPQVWIDYGTDTIDTTLIKMYSSYYRFTKYEGTKRLILEKCDTLFGEWERIKSPFLDNTAGVEGPTCFALHPDDYLTMNNTVYKSILLADKYGSNGYFPVLSDDLSKGSFKKVSAYKMPGTIARHGTVLNITHEEHEKIKEGFK